MVLGGVQAVHGVHDHWNACEPAHDASVHPRLGVVGVQHVEALPPEDPVQLARGAQVGDGIGGAGRGMERDVTDPGTLELRDERPRCADPDRFAARVAHRAELREQQQPQTDVGRREVRDLHRVHRHRLPRGSQI